ncbi:MAG: PaaI family thioesterase [Hyphomicrobiaceae bacterium]
MTAERPAKPKKAKPPKTSKPPGATAAPEHAAFEQAVRECFARQGLMRQFGAWLDTVEAGCVVIEVPYSERLSNQHGGFHGGVAGAIGDAAGGCAALSLMPTGSEVATVEYKINVMRQATGRSLRAEARILRHGRSLSVAQIDIAAIGADGTREAVALMQATYMRMAPADG